MCYFHKTRCCWNLSTKIIVIILAYFFWHINLCRLFKAKSIFIQIITFISNNSVLYEYTVQSSKTFLFQAIQFSQTVLIQIIQFSGSTIPMSKNSSHKYAVKMSEQFLFEHELSISIQFKWQISSISNNSV